MVTPSAGEVSSARPRIRRLAKRKVTARSGAYSPGHADCQLENACAGESEAYRLVISPCSLLGRCRLIFRQLPAFSPLERRQAPDSTCSLHVAKRGAAIARRRQGHTRPTARKENHDDGGCAPRNLALLVCAGGARRRARADGRR